MKKKLILLFLCFCAFGVSAQPGVGDNESGEAIPLEVWWDNTGSGQNPFPKSPIYIPSVSISGTTIFFMSPHADFSLQLVGESGNVVYEVYVPYNAASLQLPSSLSGSYEIRFLMGTYYYRGYIEL